MSESHDPETSGNAPFYVREPEAAAIPLLVSIPHTGTDVPADIAARFASPTVAELPDTDWHQHRLYDFVPQLGARTIYARYSRYVVDLNRPADGQPLYPGRNETGLVPTSTFGNESIYRSGDEPDRGEIRDRTSRYWRPYHDALRRELDALRERFGFACLWDAHSIPSVVPRFFEGELPALMLGDVEGKSAAPAATAKVLEVQRASEYSFQPNAPFKGGYITRSFGEPENGVHALQLEMSQRIYMEEGPPFVWREDLAATLRPVLRACLTAFVDAVRAKQ